MQRMLGSIILKQKKFGNTKSLCKNGSKEVIIDRGPQSNRYPRIQSSLFWSIVNDVRIEGGKWCSSHRSSLLGDADLNKEKQNPLS